MRRNPKISGTRHNVLTEYRQASPIGFLCGIKGKVSRCVIHYAKREDAELAADKLAYLGKAHLDNIKFQGHHA